ncbi:MAG: hypothetical protein D6782_13640 [Alphaproteobacteria bacterium]|nr:MAG: hypothetical protein D6782_13640 [Alphaproteobacteria bacterium]
MGAQGAAATQEITIRTTRGKCKADVGAKGEIVNRHAEMARARIAACQPPLPWPPGRRRAGAMAPITRDSAAICAPGLPPRRSRE